MTILLPGLLLAALGVRMVRQERRLADQQLRERIDRAADNALRSLEREVREWQSALDQLPPAGPVVKGFPAPLRTALTDPGSAIVVRRESRERSAWPVQQLLYDPPTAPSAPEAQPAVAWPEAELAELRQRDYERALRLYDRALAVASTSQVRATALHRVARTLRKAGRSDDALAAYRRLAAAREHIDSLPADLIARHEICSLLAERRASAALASAGLDLYRDLIEGRWRLEKARFLYYTTAARVHAGSDPSFKPELTRLMAIEERKTRLTEAALEWLDDGSSRGPEASARFVTFQARTTEPAALLVSRGWLSQHVWPRTFTPAVDAGFDIVLTGQGGQVLFTTRSRGTVEDTLPTLATVRVLDDFHVPWRVGVAPRDHGALSADVRRRQQAYLLMLGLVVALLVSGSYLTIRVVRKEVEIARLQSDFVSTVSHEFRSPLTGIRQLGELLARGRVPSEARRQQYYQLIVRESDRLARVVENVLDVSRIDEGRREYRFERLDTARWLRAVVTEARALRAEAPHIVDSIPDGLPPLQADGAALASAVHNLVDNAVKYSPGREAVWIEAEALDGRVWIRVRDEGVGIPERDQRHIFEKFYRARANITREVKGAGLGLSLVAQIVQAHGGTVSCDSRPGVGSTFTIRLDAVTPASGG